MCLIRVRWMKRTAFWDSALILFQAAKIVKKHFRWNSIWNWRKNNTYFHFDWSFCRFFFLNPLLHHICHQCKTKQKLIRFCLSTMNVHPSNDDQALTQHWLNIDSTLAQYLESAYSIPLLRMTKSVVFRKTSFASDIFAFAETAGINAKPMQSHCKADTEVVLARQHCFRPEWSPLLQNRHTVYNFQKTNFFFLR